MIEIEIRDKALIRGASPELLEKIKKHLTIGNPLFGKKLSMGLSVWGIEQDLKYYKKDPEGLLCPIGALPDILQILVDSGIEYNIQNNRLFSEDIDYFNSIEFKGQLRPFQQEIVDVCLDSTIGVIEAKTGSGKTVSFIKLILERKQKTLILVNTKELADQTIAAFKKYTSLEEYGFIGNGKYIIKPVTVCLFQSLQNIVQEGGAKLEELNKTFGQVIADETHIIAAETYYESISALNATYKFGFSATPKREDGLTKVIFFATGPIIYKVPEEEANKNLIIPEYRVVKTAANYPLFSTTEYQDMITWLGKNEDRNKLILDEFNKEPDIPSCFLCLRRDHVETLHAQIPRSVKLISSMTKKERAIAMQKLISGEALHVVSTFGLFSTGIDIPRLQNLYLCAPMKSYIKLKQSAGRLMRKAAEKFKAQIIDFVDSKIGLLASQAKTRKKVLTTL